MAKRGIPLFIVDNSRRHKRGECDFLVCTDRDNGFIAVVDYIRGEREEAGDDYRIGMPRRGISCRIQVKMLFGCNPKASEVRTLLKAGMEYFVKVTTVSADASSPSRQSCIDFLRLLARTNRQAVEDAGSDYTARQTTLDSISMLEASAEYLSESERH